MSELVVYRNVNTNIIHRPEMETRSDLWMYCGLVRRPNSPLRRESLNTDSLRGYNFCLKCWSLDINGLPILR